MIVRGRLRAGGRRHFCSVLFCFFSALLCSAPLRLRCSGTSGGVSEGPGEEGHGGLRREIPNAGAASVGGATEGSTEIAVAGKYLLLSFLPPNYTSGYCDSDEPSPSLLKNMTEERAIIVCTEKRIAVLSIRRFRGDCFPEGEETGHRIDSPRISR